MARDQGSNADLIVSGFGSLGQRQDAEAAKNRKLNPVHAAALDRILRGEMTGEEAANWAHQNWDGASQPLPSPGGTPSIGAQGSQIPLPAGAQGAPPSPYGYPLPPGAQVQGPDGKPIALPAEGQSVGVPQGSTWSAPPKAQVASIGSYAQASPAPQRPTPEYTAQDLQDADMIAQMRQRMRPPGGLTFDQQKELENIRQGGRIDIQSLKGEQGASTQASREQMYMDALQKKEAGQKLKLQEAANLTHYQEEEKMKRLLLSLQERLAAAEQHGADNKEVAAIMAQLGEARASAQVMSSLASIVDDNLAHEQRGKYNAMLDQVEQGVSNLRAGQGVPIPKGAPAPQPGAANRPAAVQTKKTQTQTVHPNAPPPTPPARIRVRGPNGETGTMDPAELTQHPDWKAI